MKYRLSLLFFLIAIALSSCSQSIADRNQLYELNWSDEFNGKALNYNIWTKMKRAPHTRCICNLTSDERLYQYSKGRLRLYAKYNNHLIPNDTARFLTGGITSEGKRTFTYGKIEIRARIHGAIGAWPAIWIMPDNRKEWNIDNPRYAEIDLLEYVDKNNFIYQTAHNAYTLADKKNWHNPPQQNLSPIKVDKYNTYSVEILPDMLIFGVNGFETFRYPRVKNIKNQYHYGIESHIMMDMQIYPPKFWSSGVKPETLPAYMDIDWIRVYKLKSDSYNFSAK